MVLDHGHNENFHSWYQRVDGSQGQSYNPNQKWLSVRGIVVQERGEVPFRQTFWSRNGAPANIVGHRWNTNTEAFRQIKLYSLGWPSISLFSGPNCPKRGILHQKSQKIFWGGHLRTPSAGGGDPLPHPSQHGYRPFAGTQAPPLLGPRSRKPFPKSNFTTTPLHSDAIVTVIIIFK